MAKLRKGRANTTRGTANLMRETISRVALRRRHRPTHRAGRQRLLHPPHRRRLPRKGRPLLHHHSQHPSVRNIIEAIPEADWAPMPYWMEGAANVAETIYIPFANEPDAVPVRLIVQRVKLMPGSQLALFATYIYHAFITDRDGDTLDIEDDHRRHAEIENAIPDWSTVWVSTTCPRAVSPPMPPSWPSRSSPITWPDGSRASVWASRRPPPRPCDDVSSLWPDPSPAKYAGSPCIFPKTAPGKISSMVPWRDCVPCRSFPDRRPRRLNAPTDDPTVWHNRARLDS